MTGSRKIITWSLIGFSLSLFGSVAVAGSQNLYRLHQTWDQAKAVSLAEEVTFYGELAAQGDARFIQFKLNQPRELQFSLGTPADSSSRFHPQAVLYVPESVSVGPILPFDQPAETMALVYDSVPGRKVFDQATQISFQERLQATVTPERPGVVYLAVYNADQAPGRFRLAIKDDHSNQDSVVAWPAEWWRAQTWAGLSWRTLYVPLGVLGLVALVVATLKGRRLALMTAKPAKSKK